MPPAGPLILAPNHFSFMDHFFVGMFLRRQVQFMAKSQLFKRPMQWVYTHGGVFPVRRGHEDQEAFITAEAILARGGCVVMYCEGGRSRTGKLAERPRPGIGRLALESGATVVPVAIYGSQRVRNWKRLRFPQVTVQYGEPIVFAKEPGRHARAPAGGRRADLRRDQAALRRPRRARAAACASRRDVALCVACSAGRSPASSLFELCRYRVRNRYRFGRDWRIRAPIGGVCRNPIHRRVGNADGMSMPPLHVPTAQPGAVASDRQRVHRPWPVLVLMALGLVLAAAYALRAPGHWGGEPLDAFFGRWVYGAAAAVGMVLCAWRAIRVRQDRAVWSLIAFAFVLQVAGNTVYTVLYGASDAPPQPSAADALWVAFYVPMAAALALRVRAAGGAHVVVLDVLIAIGALGAISAAFVFEAILAGGSASVLGLMTTPLLSGGRPRAGGARHAPGRSKWLAARARDHADGRLLSLLGGDRTRSTLTRPRTGPMSQPACWTWAGWPRSCCSGSRRGCARTLPPCGRSRAFAPWSCPRASRSSPS